MIKRLAILSALSILCCAPLLRASMITYNITIDQSQQVPPNGVAGTGFATVVVDDVANTVMVDMSYSGLTTGATNAHIHCCDGPGVNSPVVIPFIPGGFVTGNTSGTFSALFTGIDPSIISGIESYGAYINIHTSTYPGGEIRGDITPEPATLSLFGLGLLGLGLVKRRSLRRQK